MNIINYKFSYLSDGKKVKITEELFNQLKIWEMQGVEIASEFKDDLKQQDDIWLNSQRNYYLKLHKKGMVDGHFLLTTFLNDEKSKQSIEHEKVIDEVLVLLNTRTELQRTRFIKHYFLSIPVDEIAMQEKRSPRVIQQCLQEIRMFLAEKLEL